MRKLIFLSALLFPLIACKGMTESKALVSQVTSKNERSKNTDCLSIEDIDEVKRFLLTIERKMVEPEQLLDYVQFPFKSEGVLYTRSDFINSYLDILVIHLEALKAKAGGLSQSVSSKNFMTVDDTSCLQYMSKIVNPEEEMTSAIFLEKIDNIVLITDILLIG